ncbi:hypothetical protein C8F04DRAFT_1195434, partial [Mycena alexandri]
MPILNTMRPLMAQFYKKHSHWSLEVAAYLAARIVLGLSDELEGNLLDAKIPFPDDSFVLPRFAIKSKAPLSLSRIHDDSDDAGDGDGGNGDDSDNDDDADEAPPTKKSRISPTKGRAVSVESATSSAPARHTFVLSVPR